MTPMIYTHDMRARPLFDAPRGSIHVRDLIQLRGRRQNRLSDHWVGVLDHAGRVARAIKKVEGDMFETVFVQGMGIRKGREHEGAPFLGPDGLVLAVQGRVLNGGHAALRVSPLGGDERALQSHPRYHAWLAETLFAGGTLLSSCTARGLPLPFSDNADAVGPTASTGSEKATAAPGETSSELAVRPRDGALETTSLASSSAVTNTAVAGDSTASSLAVCIDPAACARLSSKEHHSQTRTEGHEEQLRHSQKHTTENQSHASSPVSTPSSGSTSTPITASRIKIVVVPSSKRYDLYSDDSSEYDVSDDLDEDEDEGSGETERETTESSAESSISDDETEASLVSYQSISSDGKAEEDEVVKYERDVKSETSDDASDGVDSHDESKDNLGLDDTMETAPDSSSSTSGGGKKNNKKKKQKKKRKASPIEDPRPPRKIRYPTWYLPGPIRSISGRMRWYSTATD